LLGHVRLAPQAAVAVANLLRVGAVSLGVPAEHAPGEFAEQSAMGGRDADVGDAQPARHHPACVPALADERHAVPQARGRHRGGDSAGRVGKDQHVAVAGLGNRGRQSQQARGHKQRHGD